MKKSTLRRKPNKVRFLADECVGLPTLKFLQDSGFSVVTAKESGLGGKSDFEILKWAIKARRVLLLEDEIHATLSKLLKELKPEDFKKTLIIVDSDKYRIRKE